MYIYMNISCSPIRTEDKFQKSIDEHLHRYQYMILDALYM